MVNPPLGHRPQNLAHSPIAYDERIKFLKMPGSNLYMVPTDPAYLPILPPLLETMGGNGQICTRGRLSGRFYPILVRSSKPVQKTQSAPSAPPQASPQMVYGLQPVIQRPPGLSIPQRYPPAARI